MPLILSRILIHKEIKLVFFGTVPVQYPFRQPEWLKQISVRKINAFLLACSLNDSCKDLDTKRRIPEFACYPFATSKIGPLSRKRTK